MSNEGKVYFKRQADNKNLKDFTSLVVKEDLVYVGASNGSVYVFESINGNFFKEIPFQHNVFSRKRFDNATVAVQRVQINSGNNLKVSFDDMSSIVLD